MGKINLEAPINPLGYGQVGYNIFKSLVKQGQDVVLSPLSKIEVSDDEYTSQIQESLNKIIQLDPVSPTVKIYHQFGLATHIGRGHYYGWPIFELDRFSDLEKAHLSVPNTIIVCSEWARRICKDQGFDNVEVVPLGYDPEIFYPGCRKVDDKYIFFNCGKWETRKGHDILIQAFLDAFDLTDNVELWMMTENPFLTEAETAAWEKKYKQNKLWSKIKMIPRVKTHKEVADIMRYVDCGVFPARAEGWNLEALEMLACQKELIITDYSAHSEYANKYNSHLINITELETAIGANVTEKRWFYGQGMWGRFNKDSYDQLVHHMEECYYKRPNKAKTNIGAKLYTWDGTVRKLLDIIYED